MEVNGAELLGHANWITMPERDGAPAGLPIFRRTVHVDRALRRATIAVCGLGHFELRVNGVKVGDDLLEPGWTNYRKTCLYVKRDLTTLLNPGDNRIDVLLGNGMYHVGTSNRYKKFKASFGPPKLLLALQIDLINGTCRTVASDASWQCAVGPITFSCIYGGEDHDARRDEPTEWQPAALADRPGGALVAQTAPPIRVHQNFPATIVGRPETNILVFDCGQNMSGWPQVQVKGPAGSRITLITGELLDEAGRVTQKNSGSPVYFTYTLRGDGRAEAWHPRFSYTGLRYVEARLDGCEILSLNGQFVHAAAEVTGTFECSSERLNRIHRLILAAIKSNLQSVLTDCPHREKLGWLEQTHLMAASIVANFDVRELYRKIARDMRDAQHADGCIPTIAPQYVTFEDPWSHFNNSPEWGSAIVISPWLIFQHYGDRSILQENYEAMRRYVEYLHARADDGIVNFGLSDWYDIGPGDPGLSKLTSKALTGTAIFYRDLTILARVAALLNQSDDADRFASMARSVRGSFNARLFNPATGQYDRASQTANAMALALGLVEPSHRSAVLKNLIDDIRGHDDHVTAGDIGFKFVLDALADMQRSDVILDLLSRDDPPSYGAQLRRGATTLTEAWDANPRKSQNHLMLGHAEAWFFQWLAGIQIDLSMPPPQQITIRPTPVGGMRWVGATRRTVLGSIACRWERAARAFQLQLEVPPEIPATVYLPTTDPAAVRQAGQTVDRSPGIASFRADAQANAVVLVVVGGKYLFDVDLP